MAYFVYIVECADKTYYCGSTNNVEKRIEKHNSQKSGAKYTKARRPVVLKYFEEYATSSEALKREHTIKKNGSRKKRTIMEEVMILKFRNRLRFIETNCNYNNLNKFLYIN